MKSIEKLEHIEIFSILLIIFEQKQLQISIEAADLIFMQRFITGFKSLIIKQNKMEKIDMFLLILQLSLFLMGRILDDMTWYDVGVADEVNVFQSISLTCMLICVAIQCIRKKHIDGWWKIFFWRSQLKFVISWSLVATCCYLFFNIFGCHHESQDSNYFFVLYTGCVLNITQILLTNLNFSLICNTKAHLAELVMYEAIIFGEIIYNGDLIMLFINNLEGHEKEESILLISLLIANQVLIMDLIFRAAYEDKEREEEKEEKMLGHLHKTNHIIDAASLNSLDFQSPTKK